MPPSPLPPLDVLNYLHCDKATAEANPSTASECYAMYGELYNSSAAHQEMWVGEHPPPTDDTPGVCLLLLLPTGGLAAGSVSHSHDYNACLTIFAQSFRCLCRRAPPTPPPAPPEPPSPPPGIGWYWSIEQGPGGNLDNSCDAACAAAGLLCDADAVKPLLSQQDPTVVGDAAARAEWLRIAGAANVNSDLNVATTACVNEPSMFKTHDTLPHVPSHNLGDTNSVCSMAALPTGGEYIFACGGTPGQDTRRRLCYCTPHSPTPPPPSPVSYTHLTLPTKA